MGEALWDSTYGIWLAYHYVQHTKRLLQLFFIIMLRILSLFREKGVYGEPNNVLFPQNEQL